LGYVEKTGKRRDVPDNESTVIRQGTREVGTMKKGSWKWTKQKGYEQGENKTFLILYDE
jgi:hypothetical protein